MRPAGSTVGDSLRFRVLGPVEAEIDGVPLPIQRPRQRAILGYLLLNRNMYVSSDRLVDALWDGDGPSTARSQVQTELSRLRRLIRSCGVPDPVTTGPIGYTIPVDSDQLDLDAFTSLVHAASTADNPAAIADLRAALDLWTGTPLEGITAAYAPAHRIRLEEQRLRTYEQLFDRELAEGRHSDVIPEVCALVKAHPLSERLTAQLVLACYRSGRQADALAAIRSLRARLADEQGLDLGRELQDLERAVLRSDPALDLPAAHSTVTVSTRPTPPMQVPRSAAAMVVRSAQVAQLDRILLPPGGSGDPALAVVTGAPGVGKTTLAVHWAHRAADRHPDGQLYANLRGFDARQDAADPADVLRQFLVALGEPAAQLPQDRDSLAGLYRTRMAGRTMLVVLDNARDAAQVRPLLPGTADSAVLVTSRNRMVGLVASHGAQSVGVDVFTEREAHDLMARRLGADRVADAPEAAAALVGECAHLPLALAMVTARAASRPTLSLAAVLSELRTGTTDLHRFQIDGDAVDIAAAFSWSYKALSQDAQALFLAFGMHPLPEASIEAAATMCGVPLARARNLVEELISASLVTEHPGERFVMHDLLRAYARQVSIAGEPSAMTRRMLDHYVYTTHRAVMIFQPGRRRLPLDEVDPMVTVTALADRHEALAWLAAEHRTLVTLVSQASGWGFDAQAWRLGWCLTDYLFRVGHWNDWVGVQSATLVAAERLGDARAMAAAHVGLGRALQQLGRNDEALAQLRAARRLSAGIGDRNAEAFALQVLSDVSAERGGDGAGLAALRRALALYLEAGNALGAAAVHNNLGLRYAGLARYDEALAHCTEALGVFQDRGEINGTGAVHDTLGRIHHGRGDYANAIEHFNRSAEIKSTLGESYLEAMTLAHLGESYLAIRDEPSAVQAWRRATDILERLEHVAAAEVRARLDALVGLAT
jgi:DNA-binding SARP family transcriptional activator